VKKYPALDVRCDSPDVLLALVDDFSPTAAEERDDSIRVFFANAADRDAARFTVASRYPVASIDVADEDWGRRSQENLLPITIGRVTIVPAPDAVLPNPDSVLLPTPYSLTPAPCTVVIVPSMGFGTGHHATTRMCVEMLQTLELNDRIVFDIGTGSGVLAIVAARLGAAKASGIDNDPDAIHAARENLAENRDTRNVSFEVADLMPFLNAHCGEADVVTANLTGTLLERAAVDLEQAVRPGGWIVASGILAAERNAVAAAFRSSVVVRESADDEWVGLLMKKP
jgi:ribosomal protein L11 methyltransferase